MNDIQAVTTLASNPLSLFAGALLFTAATAFVRELKKPKGESHDHSGNTQQLTHMSTSIGEINTVIKEVVELLATIAAQNNDSDDCEEDIKRELENVHGMVTDLTRISRDPNSIISTVNLYPKLDNLTNEISALKVLVAKL